MFSNLLSLLSHLETLTLSVAYGNGLFIMPLSPALPPASPPAPFKSVNPSFRPDTRIHSTVTPQEAKTFGL